MKIRNVVASKPSIKTFSRLGQRRQVVIPKEICKELGLREGDFVEVKMESGAAVVSPKKLVDADDVLTREEDKLVRRGEAQLKKGKYVLWEGLDKGPKL